MRYRVTVRIELEYLDLRNGPKALSVCLQKLALASYEAVELAELRYAERCLQFGDAEVEPAALDQVDTPFAPAVVLVDVALGDQIGIVREQHPALASGDRLIGKKRQYGETPEGRDLPSLERAAECGRAVIDQDEALISGV